ncbi:MULTISPECIES: hypothetical protein [Lysinibacillus]|uniref:YqkK n=1 Tax=Lysinibacillus capsici TaxID=2115968 RepID=A0ABY8KJU4_9BACI|nr:MULTISPECIES: hypothetical protein [Lysinibacillus]MCT1538455.1 hypothetical protein [Lysinibacillus capsici]MCT1569163.1 hypothetical protein [Lysinibacillus capsici]MCT1646178.1 hypothetical protein [Lysinibacillus capsici]MCT1725316.1 hypothetical protein [Lysinibacillus capsici]MCT1784096.1 hypothetical protein [Lysinibacillus capsici]
MSQSKAKKKRMHIKRTVGKDVEKKRQSISFSTHERLTKTKNEKLEHDYTKYKKQYKDE